MASRHSTPLRVALLASTPQLADIFEELGISRDFPEVSAVLNIRDVAKSRKINTLYNGLFDTATASLDAALEQWRDDAVRFALN